MKINYYSGWFDEALPADYLNLLKNDITETKSLVLVWGCWSGDELIDFVRDSWLAPGGIVFDEIHLVDNRKTKEEAHQLIKEASVLLLLGGDDLAQADFFKDYELATPIKQAAANIILGFSAGAINMPSKCFSFEGGKTTVYDGLGLDGFTYVPYFTLGKDEALEKELLAFSQDVDIYATTPESFIRTFGNEIATFGDVYLISNSQIKKQ